MNQHILFAVVTADGDVGVSYKKPGSDRRDRRNVLVAVELAE